MDSDVGRKPALEIVPLGGVMFPGPELFGVDLIIPDLTFLRQRPKSIAALVLTHGHQNHIGAVPYVCDFIKGPIFGTRLTLALLGPKLEEYGPRYS